jgi:hypothetical protein
VNWSGNSLGSGIAAAPFSLMTLVFDRRVGAGMFEEIASFVVVAMRGEQAGATPDFDGARLNIETFSDLLHRE